MICVLIGVDHAPLFCLQAEMSPHLKPMRQWSLRAAAGLTAHAYERFFISSCLGSDRLLNQVRVSFHLPKVDWEKHPVHQTLSPSPSLKPKVISSQDGGREILAHTDCILLFSLKDRAVQHSRPASGHELLKSEKLEFDQSRRLGVGGREQCLRIVFYFSLRS